MTAPSTPGPEEAGALTRREQAILDRIEHDLVDVDPSLGSTMGTGGIRDWAPISARQGVVLVLLLVVLVVTAALLPAVWWLVLAPLTVVLIVPWMLLCTMRRDRSDRRRTLV